MENKFKDIAERIVNAEEIAFQLLEDNYEDKNGMLQRCKKLAKAYLEQK